MVLARTSSLNFFAPLPRVLKLMGSGLPKGLYAVTLSLGLLGLPAK